MPVWAVLPVLIAVLLALVIRPCASTTIVGTLTLVPYVLAVTPVLLSETVGVQPSAAVPLTTIPVPPVTLRT
jgi:hypothetical protein